ncbi:MAG TPA: rhodanese-like domain-containing protein [Gammaproteobacteria bacterium]|nr:rhodanese-like domain-containing protein [Gammaproteobacteria bacterium]
MTAIARSFPLLTLALLLVGPFVSPAGAADARSQEVLPITPDITSVTVMHNGHPVVIRRNRDQINTINPEYAKTLGKCPPFCIQPEHLAPGVETIGEVEMLHYLKRMSEGDKSILVIDSRTPAWVKRATIPGSINIPWTQLNWERGADPAAIARIMQNRFGVRRHEGLWDFSRAKTLVLFCNGMWCSQSPNNIHALLRFGYPANKLKWYRGGLQDWEVLGLTTVAGPGR